MSRVRFVVFTPLLNATCKGVLPCPSRYMAMENDPRLGALAYESSWLVPGEHADKAAATARLREAGIPGIRYLDGQSRADGAGSSNYVVFDDSLIEIRKK